MARQRNVTAPYFVQLRAFERRLLREAIAAAGGSADAAQVLGVPLEYVRARGIYLGGVFAGEPEREPPDRIRQAWDAARSANTPKNIDEG